MYRQLSGQRGSETLDFANNVLARFAVLKPRSQGASLRQKNFLNNNEK